MHNLTAYQSEIARAVVDSVLHERGLTFTVEIARGGGVREMSSQLALLLLSLHVNDGVRLLRIGPAARPPNNERLVSHLSKGALAGLWSVAGRSVTLGRSTLQTLTTDELGPTVVEHSASAAVLIEVVDAELIGPEVYDRWIHPVIGASGATTVLYGRPLNGETRFECLKQRNRELEAGDHVRRHFRVPWQGVADALPAYATKVDDARARLGEEHSEFQAAYCLRPASAWGPLLSEAQRRRLQDGPPRAHVPARGEHVASVVVTRAADAGATEAPGLLASPGATAVVTVARRRGGHAGLDVVEHRWVQGVDAPALAKRVGKLLSDTWRCNRVVVQDRAGAGAGATRLRHLLQSALGRIPMQWAADDDRTESRMASDLLAAVNTRRFSLYPADCSPESRAIGHELRTAVAVRAGDGRTHVVVPSGDEGFLRGVLLLTGFASPAGQATADEPETALAS